MTDLRKRSLVLLAAMFCVGWGTGTWAQDAALKAPATTPQSLGSQTEQLPTLTTSAQLVVLDVTVTDAAHHPVAGLTQQDFTVFDQGHAQPILSFEDHSRPTVHTSAPLPTLAPGIFTNYAPVRNDAPVNVLLLDNLNTPLTDQPYLHAQLKKYLQAATPGTQIAIFVLGQRLTMMQGFTTDTELLKQAVLHPKTSRPSPLLDDPGGASDSFLANDPSLADTLTVMQQFDAEQQSFQTQMRIEYSLNGLNELARYLSGIPGRKNLIWFSGSFPVAILPNDDLQNPFSVVAAFGDEVREATSLLSKARVAVYPVDARGLQTNPAFSVTSNALNARDPRMVTKAITGFSATNADEHATMQQIASETGGEAFYNTNGLKEAVDRAVDDGSRYYTLSFRPDDTRTDGAFHKIAIHLREAGDTLSYRHGYFADTGSERRRLDMPADLQAQRRGAPPPASPAVHQLMLHGAPGPTQIIVESGIAPIAEAPSNTVIANNYAGPKLKGPLDVYSISSVISGASLALEPQPDGRARMQIEFTALLYTPDGTLVNSTASIVQSRLTPELARQLRRQTLQIHQELSIPVKGAYFIRVAVRDLVNQQMGAFEIPVSAVRGIKPLVRPTSAPAPASTAASAPK
jgi:VWFA-related protein